MKKIISILISFILIFSAISVSITTYAEEFIEEKSINNFIDGIVELSHEYDADKDFVPVDDISANSATITQFYSNGEATETVEDSLLDFQTARLIVRADEKFNDCGAVEHVQGFKDFHILQYENPDEAKSAYEKYTCDSNIISVSPDEVAVFSTLENEPINKDEVAHLNDWSLQRTQSKRLQDYLSSSDIKMKDVVVAIVDTGLDYNHEYFNGRIKRTNFNSSLDGTTDDEMDVELTHGTMVASVVVNNSLSNVKVAGYKVLSNQGTATELIVSAGVLRAIQDDSDVINLSIGFAAEYNGLFISVLEEAFEKDIPVVCSVGNSEGVQTIYSPANIEECITVSSTNQNNTISDYSDRTLANDVSAPGENIYVAKINNQYGYSSGTSFSSPCVASLVATIKSIYPTLTISEIETTLKNTASPVKSYWNYYSDYDGKGIVQFCDALGIPDIEDVQINLTENEYDSPQQLSLSCADENATILYTLDETYPDVENGTVYESPLEITDITRIRAITYYKETGYYGTEIDLLIRIKYLGDEKDFEITENGVITDYNGNIGDLTVPETINGITVEGFEAGAFNNENTYGISLPSTITEIPKNAFSDNTFISFVNGPGVLTIGDYAFECAESLVKVSFPNATEIGTKAFFETFSFQNGNFSNVEIVGKNAFEKSCIIEFIGPCVKFIYGSAFKDCYSLENVYCPQWSDIYATGSRYGVFYRTYALTTADYPLLEKLYPCHFTTSCVQIVNLPSVKTMGIKCFYDCADLRYVYMPSLTSIPKESFKGILWNPLSSRTFIFDSVETIEEDAFGSYKTERIEFSNLVNANSLPKTEKCIISMPSTFTECTEDTKGRNYTVYGTSGTYAEQWAKDNEHTFIEISQDTAILEDVPAEYTGDGEVLSPDVIGFNRTYQWYSNTEANNTTGTPIKGATSKDFNPADYESAQYYYCVVTSTDKDYDPIEIRTGVTENKSVCFHSYSSEVTTSPTCINAGITTYTCSKCGDTYTEEIPATGHVDGDVVVENNVNATCTVAGSYDDVTYCTVCGDETSRNKVEIPANGHNYNTVVMKPTCTQQGYTTYTCDVCSDNYIDDYVDALGHTEVIDNAVAPTCTATGLTEGKHCSVCNEIIKAQETVPATGHADNDNNGYCDACNKLLDPSVECNHICHREGIIGFFWRIINVFNMLFKLNPTCCCGVTHY